MARAETIKHVEETGGPVNGPCYQHNIGSMELPRPYHNWPSLLTTNNITTNDSGTDPSVMPPNQLHSLHALYLSYPLPYSHQEGQDEPQNNQQCPALSPSQTSPPPLPYDRWEERDEDDHSALPGEESDLERDGGLWVNCRGQGPLPDLLPQNERPSLAPQREAVQELEIRRVAHQLRIIGDEYNTTVLRRVHPAPNWEDWREACRGLFNFITQTLSTIYRLT